jgi:hypothetical protein
LAGLWSNSDSELSQRINVQNGTCHCGLQKFSCEKFALKLDDFGNKTPRGDRLAICSLKTGARWTGLDVQGTLLNAAPVSTQYLSFVNLSDLLT